MILKSTTAGISEWWLRNGMFTFVSLLSLDRAPSAGVPRVSACPNPKEHATKVYSSPRGAGHLQVTPLLILPLLVLLPLFFSKAKPALSSELRTALE